MIRRSEDVKNEPLRLNHSALGGLAVPPERDQGADPTPRGALAQTPEPFRPIDPKAHGPLKPGSKVE